MPHALYGPHVPQSAINAAFADDGELLFVGSAEMGNVRDAGNLGAGGGAERPGSSAARPRPGSARRGRP